MDNIFLLSIDQSCAIKHFFKCCSLSARLLNKPSFAWLSRVKSPSDLFEIWHLCYYNSAANVIFRLAQKLSYLLVDFSYRFADLLSTPRLPPVPEETALPPEETLYRGGMSVESYPQGYSQTSTAPTMPTSQMSVNMHGKYASLTIFFKVPYLRRTKQNPYRITLDGQSEREKKTLS